jgi:hypothetical protein
MGSNGSVPKLDRCTPQHICIVTAWLVALGGSLSGISWALVSVASTWPSQRRLELGRDATRIAAMSFR